MSSFNKGSKNTPSTSQPHNAPMDSGLGSSINPLSGSFGEGYQLLSGSYNELEYDDYDQDTPLSLQPASLPLLTTVIDNSSQQVASDGQNEDSDGSTVAHSSETGSTVAFTIVTSTLNTSIVPTESNENSSSNSLDECKSNANAACTDPKGDFSLITSSSDDKCATSANTVHHAADLGVKGDLNSLDAYPSDPNPIHNGAISGIQDKKSSESDADQGDNDLPSPILSHVRAQPLEIIIRGSVVEDRPGVISERTLTESARPYSPP